MRRFLVSIYNDSHPQLYDYHLTLKNNILISAAKIEKIGNFSLMPLLVLIISIIYFNHSVQSVVVVYERVLCDWYTIIKKITKMSSLKILGNMKWENNGFFWGGGAVPILKSMWPHCNKTAETLKTLFLSAGNF